MNSPTPIHKVALLSSSSFPENDTVCTMSQHTMPQNEEARYYCTLIIGTMFVLYEYLYKNGQNDSSKGKPKHLDHPW